MPFVSTLSGSWAAPGPKLVIVPWPHTPHLAGLPPRDAQGICSWEWGLEVLGPAQWYWTDGMGAVPRAGMGRGFLRSLPPRTHMYAIHIIYTQPWTYIHSCAQADMYTHRHVNMCLCTRAVIHMCLPTYAHSCTPMHQLPLLSPSTGRPGWGEGR